MPDVTPVTDPIVRPVTEEISTEDGTTVVGYPPSTVEIGTGTVQTGPENGPLEPEPPSDEPQ